MKYFFVGFMGSGKTYWAKKLAQKLQTPFFDLDECIEKQQCKTITAIFETEGEYFFREKETAMLIEIIQNNNNFVTACGGGTPCYHANMELMKHAGKVIYLEIDQVLESHYLKANDPKRPLTNTDSFLANMNILLEQRKPIYALSHKIVDPKILNNTNFAEIFLNDE
jgi:shikimate kinase